MNENATENWHELHWDEVPYICFDTETTGFSKEDRICEIAIILAQGGEVVRQFHQIIDPLCFIGHGASEVHGLYDDDVTGKPTFADVKDELTEFFRLGAPWVAHNMPFDARMLSYDWPAEEWPTWIPTLCTMNYSKSKHASAKRQKKHKLADVANYFGVDYDPSQLHDALYDTEVLARIVPRMLGRRSVGDTFTKYSHEWRK